MTDFSTLTLERRDGVAVITLRRPDRLNAINTPMADDLKAALNAVEADGDRALVITGEGRAFCSGTDLKSSSDITTPEARVEAMHALMLRLVDFPVTTVAALNGLAVGGGLELALAFTFRVAAPRATFGLPEVKLAMMPSYGGTQLLPRLIGPSRALKMMLSGDSIDANEALAIGLIDEIAEDPVAAARALALRCSGVGDAARRLIRRAVMDGALLPLAEALAIEKDHTLANAKHPDVAKALAAFRARR